MFDVSLQETLHKATQFTRKQKNEFISLEHFLWSAIHIQEVKKFLTDFDFSFNFDKTKQDLEEFIFKMHPKISRIDSNYNPEPTLTLHRSIERALKQSQNSGKNTISVLHVLLSMFEETDSFALFVLENLGVTPLLIMEYLSQSSQQELPGSEGSDPIKKFCENLNEKYKVNQISHLIGREKELERILEVLSRKTKNNPLLVGDPGVGKTAIGEGLAELIVEEKSPKKFLDSTVFSLDLTSLLAGAKYRGDFESRMKSLLNNLKNIKQPLLFIDEVHSIVGAGSTNGSNIDLASLLKPTLTDTHLKIIGSTTYSEYRKYFAKDAALSRRFQPIFINEPSQEETLKILNGRKKDFEDHHNLEIKDVAIKACVELSGKHILDRKFPDKAFDLLDETCAHESTIKENAEVTDKHVIETLKRVYKITLDADDTDQFSGLKKLKPELSSRIFGQENAIQEVYSSILLAYSGLGPKNKPLGSFLFTGPTGVGKTELTRQLASFLNLPFIKFDMSEYMEKHSVARLIGAPPGYVGHEDGGRLTDEVSKNPHCVLLLDEIEKAHPDVINVLLQVMDSGELTDAIGKKTFFNQCILIMTSNSGAREADKGSMGIYEAPPRDFSERALKEFFSPEFLNRLTAIVNFNPLGEIQLKQIIEKELNALKTELKNKDIDLNWSKDTLSWVYENGFQKGMGARPYERFIYKKVRLPIAEHMLNQKKSAFGIDLRIKNRTLALEPS